MHKLLVRQLRRFAGKAPPEQLGEWADLLGAVDAAYHQSDADRLLLERSLDLTAQEVVEKNFALREELVALHRAQDRLRRSEASFRELIERSPDAVLVHRQNAFIYANPPACQLLGCSQSQLIGRTVTEFVHPDDRPESLRRAQLCAEGHPSELREIRILRLDGTVVPAEVSAMSVEFEAAPAVMVIARDISDRKQMQERLFLSERLASIGTLVAGVAHEINNPLCYVLSNLAYLREAPSGPQTADEVQQILTETLEGAERVRDIVRDLKVLSRSDEAPQAAVDLASVLQGAIKLAQHEVKHRAQLLLEIGELPAVAGNASRLGQVFLHLLVNAAQAIAPGRAQDNHIAVRASHRGNRVVVEVEDSGAGISPEVQKRMFDPFFTTKPVGVGTGLGLAICHGIVRSAGGEIEVESISGKGTTFRVLLPVAAEAMKAAPVGSAAPRAECPRRQVLIIDDEPSLASALKRSLSSHEVTTVGNAHDALVAIRHGGFDAIVCDMMMPDTTGMELYLGLERSHPQLAPRVIFMSGGVSSPELCRFLDGFAGRLLAKPIDLGALEGMIEQVSAGSGGQRLQP